MRSLESRAKRAKRAGAERPSRHNPEARLLPKRGFGQRCSEKICPGRNIKCWFGSPINAVRECHSFFHISGVDLNHISGVDLIFSCKNHFLESTPDLSQCRFWAKSQNFACYRGLFLMKISFKISKNHRKSFKIAFRNVDFIIQSKQHRKHASW